MSYLSSVAYKCGGGIMVDMVHFFDDQGRLHREDGPALIGPDGSEFWCIHGKRHRVDGPALVRGDGVSCWYYDDVLHRDDGPAICQEGVYECWYKHGARHRADGPAITHFDWDTDIDSGDLINKYEWYWEGNLVQNRDEFKSLSGCSDEFILVMSIKYGEIFGLPSLW